MSVQFKKHYFSVDDYYRMAEVGLLSEDSRVELIEGEIIELSPIGNTHGGARAEIPEAWLMVLQKGVIEVHSQPKNGKYQKGQRLKRGKTLVSPTLSGFSCKVEDLLG